MTKQINIRVPDDILQKIEAIAAANNTTITKVVADAIALNIAVAENMEKGKSRLVIERPKYVNDDNYKLLLHVN